MVMGWGRGDLDYCCLDRRGSSPAVFWREFAIARIGAEVVWKFWVFEIFG